MHPKVASAVQEIDAAVFSGDTFEDPTARSELLEHIAAWTRELASHDVSSQQNSKDVNATEEAD